VINNVQGGGRGVNLNLRISGVTVTKVLNFGVPESQEKMKLHPKKKRGKRKWCIGKGQGQNFRGGT